MKEQPVTFRSGGLTLEGMIARPAGSGPYRAAVMCHPHPLYGGSMYNNIVDAVLEALHACGFATLRFNFRGVGRSEGEFDNGRGEAEDAVAAVRFLVAQESIRPDSAVLAGYSFGAIAAVRAAAGMAEVAAIAAIALPLGMIDASVIDAVKRPTVLLAGENDSYCPAKQLSALAERLGSFARLCVIPGADHFFAGHEQQVKAALIDEFGSL